MTHDERIMDGLFNILSIIRNCKYATIEYPYTQCKTDEAEISKSWIEEYSQEVVVQFEELHIQDVYIPLDSFNVQDKAYKTKYLHIRFK